MSTQITATFEVTGWDAKPYNESVEGPKFSRVSVTKTFTGAITGTSAAELLMCGSDDNNNAGYIAQERVEGRIDGRMGSFVIQHGGIVADGAPHSFGNVVPGSGTGELKGLRGECKFQHDEQGAIFTLDYDLE